MIVWLPHLFKQCITCACNNLPTPKRKQKPEKHTPTQRETKQTETNHHQNSERRRRKEKKNRCGNMTYRCSCRSWRTGPGGRSWPRCRDTRGIPNPRKGVWVSPAPEKEGEKERKTTSTKSTKQPEKEKNGTTDIVANRGQVLKGDKPNTIPTPETKKTNRIPNIYHRET